MNKNNLFLKLTWLFIGTLLLVGCEDGLLSGTLIFEGTHQFGGETVLLGDVLVQAGTAEFAAGSKVAGSVYVVGGVLVLDGIVDGDLVLLDGQATLAPRAVVGGDVRMGGAGTVQVDETAVVRGEIIHGLALPQTQSETSGWQRAGRWLVGSLLLAALGGLWARRQPARLHHISQTATAQWPAAGALGLLVLLVLPTLLVMMAFTIVLLPLVVIIVGAILLVLGLGIMALGEWLGRGLGAWRKRPFTPGWATFWGTLLLFLVFQLPWLGNGLFLATAVLLLGAMLLSRFGTRAYEPPSHLAASGDLSSYSRPSQAQRERPYQ